MGNQLIKDYEIFKDDHFVGGAGGLWKIYSGRKLDKSAREVSIFIFDKKQVSKLKKSREDFYNFMRKESQTLARYKHPNILGLVEPLVEDKERMAFVTERVQGTLLSMINRNDNSFYSSEMEEELVKTITFLHNDVKVAHLGVAPENIYVTPEKKWKLAGLVFSTQVLQSIPVDVRDLDHQTRQTDQVLRLAPNYNFSAPEVINTPAKCHFASDIFSVGQLLLTIYKCRFENSTKDPYFLNVQNRIDHTPQVRELEYRFSSSRCFQNLPEHLKQLAKQCVAEAQHLRPTTQQLLASELLQDPFVKALKHLEGIAELDQQQQQNFLKGLQKIFFKYDQDVLKARILPQVMTLSQFVYLVPVIIEFIIMIMNEDGFITLAEFNSKILPTVKAIISAKEISAQGLFLIISHLQIFFKFVEKDIFVSQFLPLAMKCYECKVPKLQVLVLSQTEFLMQKLDYMQSKSQILPRILSLSLSDKIEVRRAALLTLSNVYQNLDKAILNEQVLLTLDKIRKLGTDNQITMLILKIYEGIAKKATVEVIGLKLLPQLIPYLIEPSLSREELEAYVSSVKSLVQYVADERGKAPKVTKQESMSQLPTQNNNNNNDDFAQFEFTMQAKSNTQIPNEFDFLQKLEKPASKPTQPPTQATQPIQPSPVLLKSSVTNQAQEIAKKSDTQNSNNFNDMFFPSQSTNSNGNFNSNSNVSSNNNNSNNGNSSRQPVQEKLDFGKFVSQNKQKKEQQAAFTTASNNFFETKKETPVSDFFSPVVQPQIQNQQAVSRPVVQQPSSNPFEDSIVVGSNPFGEATQFFKPQPANNNPFATSTKPPQKQQTTFFNQPSQQLKATDFFTQFSANSNSGATDLM